MKAAYFADKSIAVKEWEKPELEPGEALLRPVMAGICNTDVELFKGYYGFKGVPGHEVVAVVEQAKGRPELEGERVCVDINFSCRDCAWCHSGRHRHCPNRQVLGIVNWSGCFAEYFKAPIANLHLVDESIPDKEAVFTELLAAALEVGQQLHLTNQQRLLVLGDGKLGLLIALGLRHYVPGLTLVGKHPEKLDIAAAQGVNCICVPHTKDINALSKELAPFDVVVEATGAADGLNFALDFVRPEGVLVAKTTSHAPTQVDMARIVVDEISIVGSRCGDMDLALRFLENKWVDVSPLIEATYPFSDFVNAFERAMQPGAKKVLVSF